MASGESAQSSEVAAFISCPASGDDLTGISRSGNEARVVPLIYPVWATVAMAASVTVIFANSRWRRADLLFDANMSVGRPGPAVSGDTVS